MINAELDLYPGQLDKTDKRPVDYCSPDGQFRGTGYTLVDGTVEPMYEKVLGEAQKFVLPINFQFHKTFKASLKQFITSQQPTFVYPTRIGDTVYVGTNHALAPIEVSNNMMAFRNAELLPLTDREVQNVIKHNFNALQTSSLYGTTVGATATYTPLTATDSNTGITVVSFKNGVLQETINSIYTVDINSAINVIQQQVKVPLTAQQLISLLSLAFEVKAKRLYNSKLLTVLNNAEYHKVPSYFMEFAEIELPNGKTLVNEESYNRRYNEAELFSTIFESR
jgi:GH24 family phage-related lysozyme (muramidase)|tara:strand:- start:1890 stop:2732 length:843 start_codon:yes stop_codon:yes gene_type:complete